MTFIKEHYSLGVTGHLMGLLTDHLESPNKPPDVSYDQSPGSSPYRSVDRLSTLACNWTSDKMVNQSDDLMGNLTQ